MTFRYAFVTNSQIDKIEAYEAALSAAHPKLLSGLIRPIVVENESFDPVTQVRTGPDTIIEPGRVVERYTVRDKLPAEIAAMRTALTRRLQLEFARRIDAIMPSGAQFAMMIAGFMGVLNTGLDRNAWPAAVRNVFNPLFTIAQNQGAALYQVYQTKLAEIGALTTPAQIAAYDVTAGWP